MLPASLCRRNTGGSCQADAKLHIKIDVSTLTRGAAFITRALSTIKKSGGEKKGGFSVLKYVYALAGVRLFE